MCQNDMVLSGGLWECDLQQADVLVKQLNSVSAFSEPSSETSDICFTTPFSPHLTSWILNMHAAVLVLSSPSLPITTHLLVPSTHSLVF